MGMPISCYSTLLGITGHDDWLRDRAREALRPFTRFAFVIHDPATHAEFDAVLNAAFDDLDQTTGEHLLFFALVRPESADIEGLKQRRYYKLFADHPRIPPHDRSVVRQLVSPESIPVAADTSLSAWVFARALGISYDLLPCIVTTDNLENHRIEIQRSSPETLERQLLELGKAESRRMTREDPRGQRERFPSAAPDRSITRLGRSLASTLACVLGAMHAAETGDDDASVIQAMYRDAFAVSLRELLEELQDARRVVRPDEEVPEEFEHLALTIAGVLHVLAPQSGATAVSPFADPSGELFDPETRIMLKTGMRCLHALAQPPWLAWNIRRHLRRLPGQGPGDVDFSPSLMCFAKAFEREMNLSAVHWVRQRLGISLPEHFNRVQAGVSAVYIPPKARDGLVVDFNRDQHGAWLPPTLGQSEIVCGKLAGEHPPEPFTPETWRRLMQSWRTILLRRNGAAHHRVVAREECDGVVSEMTSLIESGVFQATAGLRHRLMGAHT